MRYACDTLGTGLNDFVASEAISRLRTDRTIGADWSALIAEDYENRGKQGTIVYGGILGDMIDVLWHDSMKSERQKPGDVKPSGTALS